MYILFQKVDNSVYKNQSCRSFLTLVELGYLTRPTDQCPVCIDGL